MDLVTPTILCLVCSFHTTPIRVALRPMIINYPTFPMAILRIITNQPPFAMAARLRQLLPLQMQPPVIVLLASSLGITLVEEVSNSIDFNWHTASDLSKIWHFKKLYTVVLHLFIEVLKVYKSLSNL